MLGFVVLNFPMPSWQWWSLQNRDLKQSSRTNLGAVVSSPGVLSRVRGGRKEVEEDSLWVLCLYVWFPEESGWSWFVVLLRSVEEPAPEAHPFPSPSSSFCAAEAISQFRKLIWPHSEFSLIFSLMNFLIELAAGPVCPWCQHGRESVRACGWARKRQDQH